MAETTQQIKPISQIIKENNEEDIKNKCMCRIKKILDKDELTEQDINELNTLCNVIQCCHKRDVHINENMKCWNTKEEGEALKGLVLGNYNFEDWHIMRLLLKVKIIESLLNGSRGGGGHIGL